MRWCLVVTAIVACGFGQPVSGPTLIIINARVFTADAKRPWTEAVAIRGDRIDAIGSTAEVRKTAGPSTRIIDARGRLVIPGINDAHAHPGAMPDATHLSGPPAVEHDPTLAEVLQRLEAAVAKTGPNGWILGEIGSAVLDDPKAVRATFDPITGTRPMLLFAWTGHGAILNTAALRALSIRDDEPDPPGGFFGRMSDGRTLTGLAHEYANYEVGRRLSMLPDRGAQVKAFQQFAAEAAAFGITSVQAMMTACPTADAAAMFDAAALPIRVRLIDFPLAPMADWRGPVSAGVRPTSPLISVSGTKWIMDGTPIERLMSLRAPYTDRPSTRGRSNFTGADLRAFLSRALAAREQPMLHAVGDGAIALVLDTLESTGGDRWKPLRPRIEHGDMLAAGDFDRAKRMGVTIVQNPSHFMVGDLVGQRIGRDRLSRTFQMKAIVDAGVPLALGSDGPLNPYLNIMFASMNASNPAQALTIEQSLVAYTRGSAAAELTESQKGTLAPGMLADLAVLSQDIFTAPAAALPKTTSVLTIVGGRIVFGSL